jgi:hypothetical protein
MDFATIPSAPSMHANDGWSSWLDDHCVPLCNEYLTTFFTDVRLYIADKHVNCVI